MGLCQRLLSLFPKACTHTSQLVHTSHLLSFHLQHPQCLLPVAKASGLGAKWRVKGETKGSQRKAESSWLPWHCSDHSSSVLSSLYSALIFPEMCSYPPNTAFLTCFPFHTVKGWWGGVAPRSRQGDKAFPRERRQEGTLFSHHRDHVKNLLTKFGI